MSIHKGCMHLRISGGDLAPSLGDGQIFRGPRFQNDVIFGKKNFFLSSTMFLEFFFSFLLSDFPYLCCVKCRISPFPHKKNTYFYSFHTFLHIRQCYFSKYWGGRMHGPSPTSNFGGTVPPVPPRSLPLLRIHCM